LISLMVDGLALKSPFPRFPEDSKRLAIVCAVYLLSWSVQGKLLRLFQGRLQIDLASFRPR
jgi:hypothetical protein